ncbi:metallophosphoesterase family protein [Roseiterribacter gracilis]|uniref:Metallophosphoesterase n=1 Tax=Roseiterribacter gracilis TaxID=2812848 RepID=A0A8S8X9Y0_9PROT|nr:metallophosphoesterase [Rhodospirillales bacterium TMPK1]
MKTVAHLSDLHFGRTDAAVVAGLLDDLHAEQPDLIIISGDFTQSARSREFRAAHRFLRRLPAPTLSVPGNHDVPPADLLLRFLAPFARYRHWISDDLCPFVETDEVAVLGINTARRARLGLNWAEGSISHAQIELVRRRFDGVDPAKLRIVVAHHPFVAPASAPRTTVARRADRALPIFATAGIDLLLAGHLHRGWSVKAAAHIEHALLVVQAATATSTRLRDEPNSYNVLLLEKERIGVRVRAWHGDRFEAVGTAWFARTSRGDNWIRSDFSGH